VPDERPERGLLDTSVVIDLAEIEPSDLPRVPLVSAVTLAELAAGPHAADASDERARRQETLQRVEANCEMLPVDADVARAYGRIFAAVAATRGRKARGRRALDMLIAATAAANRLPLYTRNPKDFGGLEELVEVVSV
jgi:predicted nucleic acid-binding protein